MFLSLLPQNPQKIAAREPGQTIFCITLTNSAEIADLQLFRRFSKKLFTTYLHRAVKSPETRHTSLFSTR